MNGLWAVLALTACVYGQDRIRLTPAHIQSAIEAGSRYKGGMRYFSKGLQGKRISVTRYTDVTFFNDWHMIAMQSADAKFMERVLTP